MMLILATVGMDLRKVFALVTMGVLAEFLMQVSTPVFHAALKILPFSYSSTSTSMPS